MGKSPGSESQGFFCCAFSLQSRLSLTVFALRIKGPSQLNYWGQSADRAGGWSVMRAQAPALILLGHHRTPQRLARPPQNIARALRVRLEEPARLSLARFRRSSFEQNRSQVDFLNNFKNFGGRIKKRKCRFCRLFLTTKVLLVASRI